MIGKTFYMLSLSINDLKSGKKVNWFIPSPQRKFDVIDLYRLNFPHYYFTFRVSGDMLKVGMIR